MLTFTTNLRHSLVRVLSLLLPAVLVLGFAGGCNQAQEAGSDSSASTADKAEGNIVDAAAAGNVKVVKR